MLNSIWLKITAFMGLIISVLIFRGKRQKNKIDKLEDENEALGRETEIREEMTEARKQVQKEVEDEKSKVDDSNWRDRI